MMVVETGDRGQGQGPPCHRKSSPLPIYQCTHFWMIIIRILYTHGSLSIHPHIDWVFLLPHLLCILYNMLVAIIMMIICCVVVIYRRLLCIYIPHKYHNNPRMAGYLRQILPQKFLCLVIIIIYLLIRVFVISPFVNGIHSFINSSIGASVQLISYTAHCPIILTICCFC